MSKSNTFENDLQQFTFNNVTVPGIGTTLFVALHTADPGEAGDQLTNEAAYTGYTRTGVNRNSGGWTVAGNAATNAAEILFPALKSSRTPLSGSTLPAQAKSSTRAHSLRPSPSTTTSPRALSSAQ